MLTVASRELRSLLGSPWGWVLLALVQLVLGLVLFLHLLSDFGERQPLLVAAGSGYGVTALVVAPTFKSLALLMMVVASLLCMRSICEERRSGTLALLLGAPQPLAAIVLGKFLATLTYLLLLLGLALLLPLSLLLGGPLDLGLLAACTLGLSLCASAFVSVGLLASTFGRQPALVAGGCFLALLALWQAGAGAATVDRAWLGGLGLAHRLDPMLQGVVDSADVAYFIVLTVLCLGLAVWRLEAIRSDG